jgi:protein-export membrane protein SecD
MKRCPACSRVYDDEGLWFCLDDGTNLVDKPSDAPATTTLAFSDNVPAPTIKEAFRPEVPPLPNTQPVAAVAGGRRLWPWFLGLGVILVLGLVVVVVALLVLRLRQPLVWHLALEVEQSAPNREAAVKQAVAVIENRLAALGVSNFEVKPERSAGSGRILVDLPGLADPERIKQIITNGGKLELTHVISPPSPMPVQTYGTKEEAIASLNGSVPTNRRVLSYVERSEKDATQNPKPAKWVIVESPSIVDGSELRTASALRSIGATNDEYQIAFSLKANGAQKFGTWTAANINEYLGVVLNGEVKSIAFIKGQIYDQGQITGRFTKQAAEDLALVLKSGVLPAPLKIVEERLDK